MKLVTLYGSGAVLLSAGKDQYRAAEGVLTVPEHLVSQAEAAGYHRTRSGSDGGETVAEVATSDVGKIAGGDDDLQKAPVETLDEKVARYRAEIEARGYMGDAVESILAERLRFDELVAGGMAEEDAAKTVWGGGEPSTEEVVASSLSDPSAPPAVVDEKPEAKANADVTALSADGAAVDKVD